MHECLSTHNNPSVQNKSYVSLNPVNLKPFYIKPYLTHESEIKFAQAEMEKLRQMGILHKGSSEFLSPIMLIKMSHSGKLSHGLNISSAYFTSLMNDLLHELPADICEFIDCIMDDVIIFTPDIKTHMKVIKSFMLMLKKYGMLLTINTPK